MQLTHTCSFRRRLGIAGTFAILVLVSHAWMNAQGIPRYAAAEVFGGGGTARSSAMADLNSDNIPDLIASDTINNNLRIYLGKGNGELRVTPVIVPNLVDVTGIRPRDFNNDGKMDLAVIARNVVGNVSGVLVLLGNGNGTFGTRTPHGTGFAPFWLLVDDFNADGNADFVIFDNSDFNLKVYLGNGLGGHGLSATITSINALLATGDFNGDGKPEIIARRPLPAPLAIIANNGDGTFAAPATVSIGTMSSVNTLVAGHFNGDSNLDLFALSTFTSMIPIFGNGNNTFTAGTMLNYAGSSFSSPSVGDFNHDQKTDLVLDVGSGKMWILNGNGNGTFQAPAIYGAGGGGATVVDLNGDTWHDLVTSVRSSTGNVSYFTTVMNRGNGTFLVAPDVTFSYAVRDIATGNINGDGIKDIVTVSSGSGPRSLYTAFGTPQGSYIAEESPLAITPSTVVVEDFNNDGARDAVVGGFGANGGTNNFAFLPGNGTQLGIPVHSQIGTGINDMLAADLNSDGNKDLAFAAGFNLMTALGNGNGSFASPTLYPQAVHGSKVASGDFNGDGHIDLAGIQAQTGEILLYINNGSGAFTPGPPSTVNTSLTDLSAADLDGDSKVDLVCGTSASGLYVLKGNGNGTFQMPAVYATQHRSLEYISLKDLNQDGKTDVAVKGSSAGALVLINNGSGVLIEPRIWGTVQPVISFAVDDMNGDQRPDILAGSIEPGSLSVLVHRENTPRSTSTPFDFDGDGKADLGIFRPSDGTWWINRSSNASTFAAQFGATTDRVVPADYTGDGKADIAVWRPASGEWFVLRSEDFSFYSAPFGASGDMPVPGDYDADRKADIAVFRPSSATWFITRSSGGTAIEQFGTNGDQPVAADYDGDGRADLAIFRPSNGQWWLNRSTAGLIAMAFGNATDKAVPGDYTGDGKADVAFWRTSTGEWFVLRSEDFSFFSAPFGASTDIAAAGDYDGDGRYDFTVFRPSSATWFSQRTTAGTLIQQFGAAGDTPLANAYVR